MTRVVHIAQAESLSSDSMIWALRRFIARRGTPRVQLVDNGTNFVGSNKELMNMQDVHERMTKEADVRTITWKFKPPGAPNVGGAWSVWCDLPLTEVDIAPTETEGFTPNHFLIGRSRDAAATSHFDDSVLLGPANWRACQRLSDHLWQKWLREYLPTLVLRRARGDPICRAPPRVTSCIEAKVIGIPKLGKPRDLPASYRPISLLSSLGKLYEKIRKTRLNEYLFGKGLIINEQIGLIPNLSCPQQALRLVEYITEGFKTKKRTVGVFIDVAKAFDRVSSSRCSQTILPCTCAVKPNETSAFQKAIEELAR
ncbi:Probable RNA-directed DNA polymerase from transposon X-element [Eumeta japonica]|uniref:Probable RNA-directed DNA polymerase from transposon X-element n=1 Tax=Eumeta variegata TaxID=151549 RepID=A0A4C1ZKX1_EUMVA|nr:Probable RNA-directed DNA polymerase from transposon X-element [Eumeta japonica]